MDKITENLLKNPSNGGTPAIENKRIVKVEIDEEKYTKSAWDRLFISQIRDESYYQVYKEVLSDHFPIFMECHTDLPDDDDRL